LQRHDNRHLHQPTQGMRQYRERPSMPKSLLVEIPVVVLGEIVNPAFKQSNDSVGRMRCRFDPTPRRTTSRFSGWFVPFLTLSHGEFNPLPVFKSNFRERFEDPIFVQGFDRFRHGKPR
jgi:hypothetical protein